MTEFRIEISDRVRQLVSQRIELTDITAVVSSNLEYMPPLEYGHSSQAPEGMVRRHLGDYNSMVDEEVNEALRLYGADDITKTVKAGISMGALRVMRAIADRTPVDTGRAKGSWIVTLPGGKRLQDGPKITAERQATIRNNRRKRKR